MAYDILLKEVSYIYGQGTPFETKALDRISLAIPSQKVTAIVGHTGSGKSTLIQHLNVLVQPSLGEVEILGQRITPATKPASLKALRQQVGVVFQFPEAQLFEETVLKDVMFGPKNFGLNEDKARQIAKEKLKLVGIDEVLHERSPFDLSGGQMRRVAIAGVLALEPKILVLDEPTAGLDPLGHLQMMEMFMALKAKQNLTLVMVTHQMDDVAQYADHVLVMEQGRLIQTGAPQDIFKDPVWANHHHIGLPQASRYYFDIIERLGQSHPADTEVPLTVEALAQKLIQLRLTSDKEVDSHV